MTENDFAGPNGLRFSPDGRLYVSGTGVQFAPDPAQRIQMLDVGDGGTRLSGSRALHTAAPRCVAPDGALPGRIKAPFTASNVASGGRNRARLFIGAFRTSFAIQTNTRGAARP